MPPRVYTESQSRQGEDTTRFAERRFENSGMSRTRHCPRRPTQRRITAYADLLVHPGISQANGANLAVLSSRMARSKRPHRRTKGVESMRWRLVSIREPLHRRSVKLGTAIHETLFDKQTAIVGGFLTDSCPQTLAGPRLVPRHHCPGPRRVSASLMRELNAKATPTNV